MLPRKFVAIVAIALAALMPVRGFAATMIASCVINGGLTSAEAGASTMLMPCHDLLVAKASQALDAAMATEIQAPPAHEGDEACKTLCSACATSCAAPVLTPDVPFSSMPLETAAFVPAPDISFKSAELALLNKPPVL